MSTPVVISPTHRQVLKMLPRPRHKIVKALMKDGLTKTAAETLITTMLFSGLLSTKNHQLVAGPKAQEEK